MCDFNDVLHSFYSIQIGSCTEIEVTGASGLFFSFASLFRDFKKMSELFFCRSSVGAANENKCAIILLDH